MKSNDFSKRLLKNFRVFLGLHGFLRESLRISKNELQKNITVTVLLKIYLHMSANTRIENKNERFLIPQKVLKIIYKYCNI